MRRWMILTWLLLATSHQLLTTLHASQPTHALIKQGQVLYANDSPLGSGQDVGPWRLVPLDFDPQATYTTKSGSVPSAASFDLPPLAIAVNGTLTPLVRDTTATKGVLYRGGNCELQVQFYPDAARLRLRQRVKYGEKIDYLALRLGSVSYAGYRVNLSRDGEWDGRANCQFNGKRLCVLVMDAVEKYPRGIKGVAGACDVVLHTNDLPNDYSREGIVDLRAYCTGTLTPALCPAYGSFLTSDPEIKAAALEVTAADQIIRQADMFVSAEVWLSTTPPEPASPLVFLGGFTSPFWSQVKPGVAIADLQVAEKRLLDLAQRKLAGGPRGAILYGDYAEAMLTPTWPSFHRVRSANHYFVVELAWRSFLRTGNSEWYKLARVFSAHQLSYFADGQQSHAKGLLPTSGPTSSVGHWVSPDFMGYWCDGDLLWANEIDRWMKAFAPPVESSREAVVPMRMARLAAVYDAANSAKWNSIADSIETRMHAKIAEVKATPLYQQYGLGMPTGMNWHPLAYKVPPDIPGQRPEGILSARQLAAKQKLDDVASYILHGVLPVEGKEIGFGPLGEGMLGLQMEEAVYDWYRARQCTAKHPVVYGTPKDNTIRIYVEKSDDAESELTINLIQRIGGDFHPQKVYLTSPSGQRVELTAGITFPKYVNTGSGWTMDPQFKAEVGAWPVARKAFPFTGPAGRYVVEIQGYKPGCLAPASKYVEWQETSGEFLYPGQDANGEWPAGGVLSGNS